MIINTEEQNQLIKGVRKALLTETMVLIDAPAGSGKTFILTLWLKHRYLHDDVKTVLCAPTNQAVDVLAKITTLLPAMTIHKLLGLIVIDDTLKYKEEHRIKKEYDIILLDEASMVDRTTFKFLEKYVEKTGTQVIFSGDHGQLPPVKENVSSIFMKKLKTFTLTKNMRYSAKEQPGLETILSYRDFNNFPVETEVILTKEKVKEMYMKETDPVILCWTNERRTLYNELIMGSQLEGTSIKMTCNKTYMTDKSEIYHVGQEITVRKEAGIEINMKRFDPSYAMTVHKAQGMGFGNVLIDEGDIRKNPKKTEMMQCLYTAVSRAKGKLIIYTLADE